MATPVPHSTPAPNKDNIVYFSHLGGKTTLAGFMWTIRSAFYEHMDGIACMSQCLYGDKIYFFVEFVSKQEMFTFMRQIGNSALKGDMGAIFIPVDISKGTTVVTLTGVPSTVHDLAVLESLKPYGDPTTVVWGSHWVEQEIYNGKRYVTFDCGIKNNIPPKLYIEGMTVLVKYPSQPKACFNCGSLLHTSLKCKLKQSTLTGGQQHGQLLLESQSQRFHVSSEFRGYENDTPGSSQYYSRYHANQKYMDCGEHMGEQSMFSMLVDASTSTDVSEISNISHTDAATSTESNLHSSGVEAATCTPDISVVNKGVQCSQKKKDKIGTRDVASWAKVRPSKYLTKGTMTQQCKVVNCGTQISKKALGVRPQGVQCIPSADHVETQTEIMGKCVMVQTERQTSTVGKLTQTVNDPLADVVNDLRRSKGAYYTKLDNSGSKLKVKPSRQINFPQDLKTRYSSGINIAKLRKKQKPKVSNISTTWHALPCLSSRNCKFQPALPDNLYMQSILYILQTKLGS